LLYFTFYAKSNASKKIIQNMHDSPLRMAIPFFVLFIGSVFVGYIFKDLFIGPGTLTFEGAIYNSNNNYNMYESEFLPVYIKLIPVIFSLLGIILCLTLYNFFHNVKL
tara:strand:- start:5198 stop:5521 length:324 start_codon:yes stop_codon:yes gene_type:complete